MTRVRAELEAGTFQAFREQFVAGYRVQQTQAGDDRDAVAVTPLSNGEGAGESSPDSVT